ncbi:MAG TPA: Wzz/FepE/Etk N-terminal domain-containing protein [Chloroflexota bacterium]|nr:Wzz/FepE/Etk N-terminal domain-containing protein [Chloroflexota bacterium]
MELREYWSIIRRRWWVVAVVTLVAFVASAAVGLRGAAAYRTDMRIAVSSVPVSDPSQQLQYDPIYYSNLDSEYLADDMSEFMHSDAFAGEVKRELATARNMNVDINTIVTATRTKKTHRFIDVTVNSATPDEGKEIADSISRIMNDPGRLGIYLRALTAYNTQMSVITPPETRRGNTLPGLISEVGLRTLIGLLIGIALAFLLDYIDQSIRSREEAEDVLRLPVLGEIPRSRRGAAA